MIAPEVERLRSIQSFSALVEYLREELDWPIAEDMAEEDMVYDYTPEEVGLDPANAVKIERIVRLRPLVSGQPWGIFYIDFRPGRLPVTVLRRILRALVVKKRATSGDRQAWELDDLLFISTLGESGSRGINLAHFSQDGNGTGGATLRVVDWDEEDTHFHFLRTADELHQLRWPEDPADAKSWRETWTSAFALKLGEVAKTSKQLAVEMARLARLIRSRVNAAMAVESDEGPLRRLYKAFQEVLLHDLTEDDFADMYAQTITYGLFAAKKSRPTPISAKDARDMVPQTNPFLRDLLAEFTEVSGLTKSLDFDELGIDALVDMLNLANMEAVIADFGDKNPLKDPVIHFYEFFLKEYDPKERIKRGEFYTPLPVVSFIVRSVDELLRTEFGLEDGLADTTTWGEMLQRYPDLKLPDGATLDTPFVQILDPAVGTGTFLVEVIDTVYRTMTGKWQKQGHLPMLDFQQLWNEYVPRHLLPRLYGFELKMAPYAIAHMKVGLKLEETDYRFASDERLRIYLTNTLEEPKDFSGQFETMAPALAREASAVNAVKRKQRFTVVVGNPPYAAASSNPSVAADGTPTFIGNLLRSYFEVDGEPLRERNPRWLQDDYVKFIRFGEQCIRTARIGVLGYVTNHGYLSNPTFRGMRQQLMSVFDSIQVLDLHGNSKKKERCPDGSEDQNVFDIQQGVAVSLWARRPDVPPRGQRFEHADLFGTRKGKYEVLRESSAQGMRWSTLKPAKPFYVFIAQDAGRRDEYSTGWKATAIFPINSTGVITKRDALTIHWDPDQVWETVNGFMTLSPEAARRVYELPADVRDWKVEWAQKDVRESGPSRALVLPITYRPFDTRFTYYTGNARGFLGWPVERVMRHMLARRNVALISARSNKSNRMDHFFVTRRIMETKCGERTTQSCIFPLYMCPPDDGLLQGTAIRPNVSVSFVSALAALVGLSCQDRGAGNLAAGGTFGPDDVLHFVYAQFYSPTYRERYAEFIRMDFPHAFLTSSLDLFRALAETGAQLVSLHLMESPKLDDHITTLVGAGEFQVEKVSYSDGTVWVDKAKTRGFRGVPEGVWNFHIGGYEVCEKWLKYRRGRVLSPEDIAHYQRIVVALNETIRLMGEIDEVIEAHGGWPLR